MYGEVSTDERMVQLRHLLEERIILAHHDFYNDMHVIIELEFVKAHNEIMEGKITNNILKERSMYYIKQKVPKELYDMVISPQDSVTDNLLATSYINNALGDIVRLYVDSVMEEHNRLEEHNRRWET
jgi:hypothetical protein